MKGFSENEIQSWTKQDLDFVDQAIEKINQENALTAITAVQYHNCTNQVITKGKGETDITATKQLREQGQKILDQVLGVKQLTKKLPTSLLELEENLLKKYGQKGD